MYKIPRRPTHVSTPSDDMTAPLNPNSTTMDSSNRTHPVHRPLSVSYPEITITEPTYREGSFLPSEPPPLYTSYNSSGSGSSSRNSSPPHDGGAGYRSQSGMLYSRATDHIGTPIPSPALSSTSEGSAAGLLSTDSSDHEKDVNERSISYPSTAYDPAVHKPITHVRGKRFLSYFRTLFGLFNTILCLICFVMTAIVIWGVYAKNKNTSTNIANRERIYAFPQNLDANANNFLISTSFIGVIFYTSVMTAPLWRSHKRFNHKRYSRAEIYEILGNIIILAAGTATLYFCYNEQEKLDTSLWGFLCSRERLLKLDASGTGKTSQNSQIKLFPDINYTNACSNYSAGVYMMSGIFIMAGLSLVTYAINPCLKRRKGEYRRDDSNYCMGIADCCSACCVGMMDCSACCNCCT